MFQSTPKSTLRKFAKLGGAMGEREKRTKTEYIYLYKELFFSFWFKKKNKKEKHITQIKNEVKSTKMRELYKFFCFDKKNCIDELVAECLCVYGGNLWKVVYLWFGCMKWTD